MRQRDWLVVVGEVDSAQVTLTSFRHDLIGQVDGVGDQDDGQEHHDDVHGDVHVDALLDHSIYNVRTLKSMIWILSSSDYVITKLFTRSNVKIMTTFSLTIF